MCVLTSPRGLDRNCRGTRNGPGLSISLACKRASLSAYASCGGECSACFFSSNRLVWLAPTFSPIVVPRSHRRLIGPTRWWANGHSHSVRRFIVVAVATLPWLVAGTRLSPSSPCLKSVGTEPVPDAGNKTFAQAWLTKLADAKKAIQRLPLHSLNAIRRHLFRTGAAQPLCCRVIRLDRGRSK